MCGRYAYAIQNLGRWRTVFKLILEEVVDKYNIAPSTTVPVFTKDGWCTMRWGLVPSWSKEPKTKYATFNARVESFITKPLFRAAWQADRRCLIPLAGYYEWKKIDESKTPFYITSKLDEPLVFAGLWERWGDDKDGFLSCTILTTAAQGDLIDLHHRMPIMLEPDQATSWLKGSKEEALAELDKPSIKNIHYFQVNKAVGNPRNQGKNLIDPLS